MLLASHLPLVSKNNLCLCYLYLIFHWFPRTICACVICISSSIGFQEQFVLGLFASHLSLLPKNKLCLSYLYLIFHCFPRTNYACLICISSSIAFQEQIMLVLFASHLPLVYTLSQGILQLENLEAQSLCFGGTMIGLAYLEQTVNYIATKPRTHIPSLSCLVWHLRHNTGETFRLLHQDEIFGS